MKWNVHPKGKITFSTIIIMILLFYGGFVAFKLISSRLSKSQLKNEIVEKLGFIRGPDFTVEKGEEVVREIMIAHGYYTEPEGQGGESEAGEESENATEEGQGSDSQKIAGTRIIVQVKDKGARIRFRVDYTDVINLILFKQKSFYTIDEEVMNYN